MSTPDELKRRKEALSPQQRAALLHRIRAGEQQTESTMPRASKSDAIPLSFAQERIWLHEQLVPGSIVYNRPANIRLRGPLQIDVLQRALNRTISQHDSLWSTAKQSDSAVLLKVQSSTELELPFTDLTNTPNPKAEALSIASKEARQPFDLSQVPLLRCHLLRIGNEDHLLLLTFHHFCFDAWSQTVLLRELSAGYAALSAGTGADDSKARIQYVDFAAWDRSGERVHALAEGRSHWQRELKAPPKLQLPTDFSRPSAASEAAGHVDFKLPPLLVQGLRSIARREGTTLFATALAAYQTLMNRYSGQRDLVVGCPVAGRNRVEVEDLIGVFINTLPLRTELAGDETFRELLQRVGQKVLAGLAHQNVPLQFIVQDVLADRDTSGSPLFQTMFTHERLPMQPRTSAGVTFEPEDSPAPATMVDLSLELSETGSNVSGRLNYRLELWERSTIERMVGHFVTLLEAVVEDADQRIDELPLLTEPERQQLLVEWNDTAVDYPRDKCVHQLFEEQVERTPDAVAVIYEEQELTYRELNERANQLAHHLIELGVGPESLVGLCLERSPELVVSILAILKSGAAYLPIDPALPSERRQFMFEDSCPSAVITRTSLFAPPHGPDVPFVRLDEEIDTIAANGISNVEIDIAPAEPAYVIYTSGSTGLPKGGRRTALRHSQSS